MERDDDIQVRDGRIRDFWWIKNSMIDQNHIAHMGKDAWAIYCCHIRHANSDSESFPSRATLGRETGMSIRAVSYARERLVEMGYLRLERMGGPGLGPSIYVILNMPDEPIAIEKPAALRIMAAKPCKQYPKVYPPGISKADLTEEINAVKCWGAGKVICLIPLAGKVTKYACVTDDWAQQMAECYPGINVTDELRAYKAWAINNPTKRKTPIGLGSSINKWLQNEQNRGPGRSQSNGRAIKGTDIEKRDNAAVRLPAMRDLCEPGNDGPGDQADPHRRAA